MSKITNEVQLNPVWHRMHSCTRMATVGVKGLITYASSVVYSTSLRATWTTTEHNHQQANIIRPHHFSPLSLFLAFLQSLQLNLKAPLALAHFQHADKYANEAETSLKLHQAVSVFFVLFQNVRLRRA